tara:strand:- start:534 stop:1868 length:1335 start_codon:yes stop_codon:yes gene_type:complete
MTDNTNQIKIQADRIKILETIISSHHTSEWGDVIDRWEHLDKDTAFYERLRCEQEARHTERNKQMTSLVKQTMEKLRETVVERDEQYEQHKQHNEYMYAELKDERDKVKQLTIAVQHLSQENQEFVDEISALQDDSDDSDDSDDNEIGKRDKVIERLTKSADLCRDAHRFIAGEYEDAEITIEGLREEIEDYESRIDGMREEISYLKANLRGADDVRVKTLTDDVSALKQELEYTCTSKCRGCGISPQGRFAPPDEETLTQCKEYAENEIRNIYRDKYHRQMDKEKRVQDHPTPEKRNITMTETPVVNFAKPSMFVNGINSTAMTLRSGTTCVSTMKKDEKYAGAYCMECAGTIDWDITESEFDDDSELHLCTACERENERLGFVGARQHAMETQQPVGIDDPLSNGEDFHTRMSRDDADEVAKYRDQPHYSPVDDQEDAGSMY